MKKIADMAEWFKALDLRPNISGCVGSNPTVGISPKFNKILFILLNIFCKTHKQINIFIKLWK